MIPVKDQIQLRIFNQVKEQVSEGVWNQLWNNVENPMLAEIWQLIIQIKQQAEGEVENQ